MNTATKIQDTYGDAAKAALPITEVTVRTTLLRVVSENARPDRTGEFRAHQLRAIRNRCLAAAAEAVAMVETFVPGTRFEQLNQPEREMLDERTREVLEDMGDARE